MHILGIDRHLQSFLCAQPTVGIKNALQEGRPLPRSLPALYRGLTINAFSMAPITAVQFGANRAFEQFMQKATGAVSMSLGRSMPSFMTADLKYTDLKYTFIYIHIYLSTIPVDAVLRSSAGCLGI